MAERVLMKGNEAFGEAAIRGGARFYFGYPITPQNELTEYMSREMPKAGGNFIQSESELAAINMGYGAACAGGNVFISSSSPGIALMQEGISFLASAELPIVLLNVARGGPGVGGIQSSQCDYIQATRGGGNGDYHTIVLGPSTMQEAVDLIYESFSIADKYRNPVMILADGMMGQMMEPIVLPAPKDEFLGERIKEHKEWALTGHEEKREHNVVFSLRLRPEALEDLNNRLDDKYEKIKKEMVRYEEYSLEDAEVVFVSFGTTARITTEAMEILEEEGTKCGMIRPISLWPFPYEAFKKISDKTKLVISSEANMGQMVFDVKYALEGRIPCELIQRSGGIQLSPEEIVEKTKRYLEDLR